MKQLNLDLRLSLNGLVLKKPHKAKITVPLAKDTLPIGQGKISFKSSSTKELIVPPLNSEDIITDEHFGVSSTEIDYTHGLQGGFTGNNNQPFWMVQAYVLIGQIYDKLGVPRSQRNKRDVLFTAMNNLGISTYTAMLHKKELMAEIQRMFENELAEKNDIDSYLRELGVALKQQSQFERTKARNREKVREIRERMPVPEVDFNKAKYDTDNKAFFEQINQQHADRVAFINSVKEGTEKGWIWDTDENVDVRKLSMLFRDRARSSIYSNMDFESYVGMREQQYKFRILYYSSLDWLYSFEDEEKKKKEPGETEVDYENMDWEGFMEMMEGYLV